MKFRSTLLLLAFISLGTTAFAQSWGFSNYGHWAQDVAIGPDGSTWAVGYGGDDPGWADVNPNYVVKIDADGNEVFGVTPALGMTFANAYSVLPTEDGGAVVYATSDFGLPFTYKVDNAGGLDWVSTAYGVEGYFYGGSAVMLSDGRIIIAGLTDFEHTIYEVAEDGALINTYTIAPDTGAAWTWSYWDYKECGITATADGGFAYATGNYGNRILYKYDADMNQEWAGYYAWDLPWEYGFENCIKTTADGGYILAGSGSDAAGNYNGTLRLIDSDGVMQWFNSYFHGAYGEEGAWATELGDGNFVIWTQNSGDQSTHGWIVDPNSGVETGEIFIPIMSATGYYEETGIEVKDVERTSDGGYVICGRMYLENYEQRMVVLKSNADGTFGDCIFDCVWPGDANNDGFATGDDLFEIGINYGADGSTRDDMSIDWSPKLSGMWYEEDTLYWYVFNDLKFTDCDGSGVINDDDTTAVINNLGLEHPLNAARMGAGDVPLYFAPATDVLNIGLNEIPIMLGDDLNSIEDIYGLTFTINVDGDNIDAAQIKVVWDDSWIGSVGETLSLSKTFGDTKQVVGSIVRKTRTNTSGEGQVGTLQIVVVDNISGKTDDMEVELSFSYAKAVMINREEIPLAPETKTMSAEEGAAISNNTNAPVIAYPNPASDVLYFSINNQEMPQSIAVIDVTGRVVAELQNITDLTTGFDISALPAGNYIVKYTYGTYIHTEEVAKQ